MPRYTTSQTYTDGNTQIVALPEAVEVVRVDDGVAPEDEDYAKKLERISEMVPLRINNTSGSSAGSGSGDFHQYRAMRRHEQDRLMRMEADYKKRMEAKMFEERRHERLKRDEEQTAKKRAKRQKKKEKKKKQKKSSEDPGNQLATIEEEDGKDSSEEEAPVQATLD